MAVEKNVTFGEIGAVFATFKVASDTTPVVGMAVTITGNGEVGKGSSGNAVAGIITHVQGNGLVTVQVKGFAEDVTITSTSSNAPAAGNVVAVDGAGKLVKVADAVYGAKAVSVDGTAKTATILL